MERTADNVGLLLRSELDEVHCVAAHADRQLRIILGMSLRIQKGVTVQNVNVQVMSALYCITIQKRYQVVNLCTACLCHCFIPPFLI